MAFCEICLKWMEKYVEFANCFFVGLSVIMIVPFKGVTALVFDCLAFVFYNKETK